MTRAATEPRSRISLLPRSNASGSGSAFSGLWLELGARAAALRGSPSSLRSIEDGP